MDKNKIKNKLKDDPAFTLEVQNPEVEALMTQYSSDKKAETLNKLIEKCTKSRFLVPANVGERLSCRFIHQRHSFLRIIRHHAL